MSEGEWTIKLKCDGRTELEDFIESLHDMDPGMTRCFTFDCNQVVELIISREKEQEVKPA